MDVHDPREAEPVETLPQLAPFVRGHRHRHCHRVLAIHPSWHHDAGRMLPMARTLTLVRHAKSDWDVPAPDRDRPLSARGRRQAPATGAWVAAHLPPVELAVVSPAARARQTWELVGESLEGTRVEEAEEAYTFDGADLLGVVRGLDDTLGHAVLVSHNPALEELVERLTGHEVTLPTSALAVVRLPGSWAEAGRAKGVLAAVGRPATESVALVDGAV